MTTSLERYDKKQLAALSSDHLMRAVDSHVRAQFSDLAKANELLKEALHSRDSYDGKDPACEKALHAKVIAARRSVARAIASINAYIEEQRALFEVRGVSPDMVYKWAIVPIGETTATGVEKCRMVKRRLEFESADTSDDEDRSVNATVKLPSEKTYNGISVHDTNRGKFNDGNRLVDESLASMERSELFGID